MKVLGQNLKLRSTFSDKFSNNEMLRNGSIYILSSIEAFIQQKIKKRQAVNIFLNFTTIFKIIFYI